MKFRQMARVIKMTIEGSHGQAELNKEQTRWVFGLRSNYYTIIRDGNEYIFTGRGMAMVSE
jgi:peptidoglycan hydrolase-like amidase